MNHAPLESYAQPTASIPDYSNPETITTLNKLGLYKYSSNDDLESLPSLGPYKLENDAVYIG